MCGVSFAFATVADLEARWRLMRDEREQARAQVLLDDASDLIRLEAPEWYNLMPETLRRVACQVVRRAMDTPETGGETLGGVSDMSWTTGPFSASTRFANPAGDCYLTKAERRLLRGRAQMVDIDLLGGKDA